MNNTPIRNAFLSALMGLGLSSSAVLAETAPAPNKLDPAWVEMESKVIKLVGKDKQRQMVDLAYATVAADKCQGLNIDGKMINQEFEVLSADTQKHRNPDEQRQFEIDLSVAFGIYVGLVLAEGLEDIPAFCQEVASVKARNGGPSRFWSAPAPKS